MGMNVFAYRPNPTGISFLVQNITGVKFVSVFNINIPPGGIVDLMAEPGISQEEIRNSLIKGELYFKLRTKDIKIFQSNVDLTSFDDIFNKFCADNGVTTGGGTPLIESNSNIISGEYNCDPNVTVNSVVYLTSSNFVDLAYASESTTQPVIGIVQSKPTITTAIVLYYGELIGQSGLITTATYYLDLVPGKYTATPPSNPGNIVQKLGFAKDANTLVLFIDRDFVVL
jgi:hypothetical protein